MFFQLSIVASVLLLTNNMKKILFSLLLGVGLVANAATLSTNLSAVSTNSLIASGVLITEITVANSGAAGVTLGFFDNNLASTVWTNSAYTNRLSYITNLVTSFTNFSGVIQTNTNSVIYTIDQAYAAATNNRTKFLTLTVSNGQTYVYTPTDVLVAGLGLTITNTMTNGTLTVKYSTLP